MDEDSKLLKLYVTEGSNDAFAELVQRYCDLVWSAAYRVLGDGDLARDAAQTAFADLARKAGRLPPRVVLAGWLHRAASLAACGIARNESRRTRREEEAMLLQQMSQTNPQEEKAARELHSMLEAALADLNEMDRNAVVLRFLSGRSLAEVGAALGTTEEAARKRVSRSVERLRELFRQRGVPVGAGVVSAALSAAGSQTAPIGLAAALTPAALAGGTALPSLALFTLMKTKISEGLLAAVMAGGLAWQYRALHQLQAANDSLLQKLAERNTAPVPSAKEAIAEEEINRLRAEHVELLRLRGEYSLSLRKPAPSVETDGLKAELAAARAAAATNRAIVEKIAWKEKSFLNHSSLKQWGLALHRFAASQGTQQLPVDFSQIQPYFSQLGVSTNLAASQDLFEFVNQGRAVSEQEPDLIVMRERLPTQSPDGEWARVYLLADGSAWYQVSPDGDFSAWEQPHMAAPGSVTPPDAPVPGGAAH